MVAFGRARFVASTCNSARMTSAMKTPNSNLARFKDHWWWRLVDDKDEDFKRVFPQTTARGMIQNSMLVWWWYHGQEFAAYAYELARRANPGLNLRQYPDLTANEGLLLHKLFGPGKSRKTNALFIHCVDPAFPMTTRAGYSQPIIFRLDGTDRNLVQIFKDFIKRQRQQHGIRARKAPGETSKRPPWRYIELLDLAECGEQMPKASHAVDQERSLRRAKRNAKAYHAKFLAKLIEERPKWLFPLWPEVK